MEQCDSFSAASTRPRTTTGVNRAGDVDCSSEPSRPRLSASWITFSYKCHSQPAQLYLKKTAPAQQMFFELSIPAAR